MHLFHWNAGTYFIEMAKKDMKKHLKNLPDADLAYLEEGTEHFKDYVFAVQWVVVARGRECSSPLFHRRPFSQPGPAICQIKSDAHDGKLSQSAQEQARPT